MFWKGKVLLSTQILSFLKGADLAFAKLDPPISPKVSLKHGCSISAASLTDIHGITKLLNEWFEPENKRVETAVTAEWIRATYLANHALWIIAKDQGGTIRGCVSSFRIEAPYPNSLGGCGVSHAWGIVDWFCVHPLWRSKGVGSELLETLDYITYRVGRKAHVFLKEGLPLPLHVPVYTTFLKCRRAGNPNRTRINLETGLQLFPYNTIEKKTGLPLIRVGGLRKAPSDAEVKRWEDAIDADLPPCIVFVSGPDCVDANRGWKTDSFVSMYAFRWVAGKWLYSVPNKEII
jgi:GNAT superfamily N-acetyltransferase